MGMYRRLAVLFAAVVSLLPRAAVTQALDEVEQLRAERRIQAHAVTLVGPLYSVAGGDRTSLYLLNLFADPLEVEITAFSESGTPLALGRETVQPSQHVRLDLSQLLAGADPEYAAGSLRLGLWGDADMLQAWTVVERGKQMTEIPFTALGKSTSLMLTSFWDLWPLVDRAAEPIYRFVNSGETPLTVALTFGPDARARTHSLKRVLAPGARLSLSPLSLSPSLRRGWLHAEHDGAPGALVATGLVEGGQFMSTLPVRAPSEGSAGAYDAIRLPLARDLSGKTRTILSFFNPAERPQEVDVLVFDAATGSEIATRRERLAPHAISSLDVHTLLTGRDGRERSELRVRVAGDGSSLLVSGLALLPTGEAVDVAFFPRGAGHPNGSYPLPSLGDSEVVHTWVNLGEEPTRIVTQISWNGGTYALEPFEIQAGASRRLVIGQIADEQVPDLLGRRLSPDYQNGFLQWTTQTGGHDVVARLETRRRGGWDVIGFNCSGCCTKRSAGSVQPFAIAFDIGENPLFQACETIHTCNSTMGPFPASVDVLTYAPPLSWDGVRVSSSDYTNQEVRWEGTAERIFTTCQVTTMTITGVGRPTVDDCLEEHNPDYDPSKPGGCPGQTSSCTECFTCCENNKEVSKCRCAELGQNCSTQAAEQCRSCKTTCVNKFDLENCDGFLTCLP